MAPVSARDEWGPVPRGMTKEQWKAAVLTSAELLRAEETEQARLRAEADALNEQITALTARRDAVEKQMHHPWTAGEQVTALLNLICREPIAVGIVGRREVAEASGAEVPG